MDVISVVRIREAARETNRTERVAQLVGAKRAINGSQIKD